MFGYFGASFGKGMLEQGEAMDRSRRDLAAAFDQFKRNNPYATYQDYQSFMDMYAGNNNYLRGGLPGDEVIQALAQQGAERKQRDLMAENLKEARSRAELMGSLEALVDRSLMGMSGDDYDKAFNDFTQSFGGPNAFPGMNVRSMFSPDRRERLQSMEARKYLPDAVKLAASANGSIDPELIAKTYGVNPDIARRVAEDAKREYASQKQKEFAEVGARTLKDMAASPELGDSFLKNYEPFLTPEQKTTFKTQLDAMREKIKKEEDDKKEAMRVEVRGKIEDGIASNPDVRAAILRSPNREGGIAVVRDYLKRRIPGHQQSAITDDDITQIYNQISSGLDNTRDDTLRKEEQAIRGTAIKAQEEASKKSMDAAGLRFGEKKNYSETQQAAVRDIAQYVDMTDVVTQDIVAEVLKEKGKSASAGELVAAIKAHPAFGKSARSITDLADRSIKSQKLREGVFDGKVIGFSEWMSGSRVEIEGQMRRMQDDFTQKVLAEKDPYTRSRMLELWKARTGEALNNIRTQIDNRAKFADRWTKTGDGWRDQDANELMAQIDAYEKYFTDLVQRETPATQQVQPGTPQQFRGFYPTTAPQQPPSATRETPIGRALSSVTDGMRMQTNIEEAIKPYKNLTSIAGPFMKQTPEQARAAEQVVNFARSPQAREYFMQYPQEFELFKQDPVAYVQSRINRQR